jgi:hypothetical protein
MKINHLVYFVAGINLGYELKTYYNCLYEDLQQEKITILAAKLKFCNNDTSKALALF